MPTGGKTKPIHVYKGLVEFFKVTKGSKNMPIWALVETNMNPDFIKKYNNWVQNDPDAKDETGGKIQGDRDR